MAASQAPDWPAAPLATSNSPRSVLVSDAATWAIGSDPSLPTQSAQIH